MAITTYDELQTAVLAWLARADDDEDLVVARVKDFITLGEARIARDLRVLEMVERLSATIDEAQEGLPARFLEATTAALILDNVYTPLKYVTVHELNRNWRYEGTPRVYTIVGCQMLFGPYITYDESVPKADRPQIELIGFFAPRALSDTVQTNDILKRYPNIYLYAALIEAGAFITLDQLQTWVTAYEIAVAQANETAEKARFETGSIEPAASHIVV